jgi:hypothetical protein
MTASFPQQFAFLGYEITKKFSQLHTAISPVINDSPACLYHRVPAVTFQCFCQGDSESFQEFLFGLFLTVHTGDFLNPAGSTSSRLF